MRVPPDLREAQRPALSASPRADERSIRVAFLGGGTGGHLAPGVAVAEELRRRGHESLFLIAGRPVERALLDPRRLSSRDLFGDRTRPSPLNVGSWCHASRLWRSAVREYDPDAIVVLGGWVSLPAVLFGFFGRPSVLLEQNARAGKVQKLLGQRVEHACLTVDGDDMPRGRRGTHVTGNPAPELPPCTREQAAAALGLDVSRRTLLLMGGSQGAGDLNALLPQLLPVVAASGAPWQVLNITGGQPAPVLERGADAAGVPVVRRHFVADMAAAWRLADIAVCRAGAGTVAELACTGTPSVLVPYPHHADHHQEANGRLLVEVGGALMVGRDDPTGVRTAASLLAQALGRLPAMSTAALRVARPRAAHDVADVVVGAAEEGT
jgi:UDP-N-acetylglucosamine--N-acetylmuramyl-(pentapeptide) pyrophosphoryl-undecaprenol N-acetylglucosamine transferase